MLAAGAVRSSCRSPAGGGVVVVAVVLVLGPRPQRQCVGIDISHAQWPLARHTNTQVDLQESVASRHSRHSRLDHQSHGSRWLSSEEESGYGCYPQKARERVATS